VKACKLEVVHGRRRVQPRLDMRGRVAGVGSVHAYWPLFVHLDIRWHYRAPTPWSICACPANMHKMRFFSSVWITPGSGAGIVARSQRNSEKESVSQAFSSDHTATRALWIGASWPIVPARGKLEHLVVIITSFPWTLTKQRQAPSQLSSLVPPPSS
jgi:hypothetical protein